MQSIGEWWMWTGFIGFVLVMLALDLYAFGGRKAHKMPVREALAWSILWVTLALAFNGLLWWYLDGSVGRTLANEKALEFLTGYLIEKSLSVDNVFVFLMIFGYFAVPLEYQRRVLLYGVLSAIVMRAVMILAGVWLVQQFAWVLYLFGVFLVVTGVKMLIFAEHKPDLDKNPLLRWLRGHMRVTEGFHEEKFFVRRAGVRYAAVFGAGADRVLRPGVRGGQHPGDLRHYHRSVHRLHLEHLRDHGPARAVFPAARHERAAASAQVRAGADPGVRRRQDARGLLIPPAGLDLALHRGRDPNCGNGRELADQPAGSRGGGKRVSWRMMQRASL